jgi:REP element-mobilizing transposase RayT
MKQPVYFIDDVRRGVVSDAIQEVCAFRGWTLLASNVRSNHIHVVVQAVARPERVVGDFKMMASRRLTEQLGEAKNRQRWTRHGSTRYLWKAENVERAIRYVVDEQGAELDAYENTGEINL